MYEIMYFYIILDLHSLNSTNNYWVHHKIHEVVIDEDRIHPLLLQEKNILHMF